MGKLLYVPGSGNPALGSLEVVINYLQLKKYQLCKLLTLHFCMYVVLGGSAKWKMS